MTSPPHIFSEDFDLNLKPIQDSLMEKFRSFLGQNNNSNSKENNENNHSFVNEIIVEENNKRKTKRQNHLKMTFLQFKFEDFSVKNEMHEEIAEAVDNIDH